MDLSGFFTGNIVRVRIVSWGFVGAGYDIVDDVTFEVQDRDGSTRLVDIRFDEGDGASTETLEAFVRVLNKRLGNEG